MSPKLKFKSDANKKMCENTMFIIECLRRPNVHTGIAFFLEYLFIVLPCSLLKRLGMRLDHDIIV